jgi:hypothetical protein
MAALSEGNGGAPGEGVAGGGGCCVRRGGLLGLSHSALRSVATVHDVEAMLPHERLQREPPGGRVRDPRVWEGGVALVGHPGARRADETAGMDVGTGVVTTQLR